jgi:(p)ppGpp synthase/HD superfamily hydrolase
MTHKEKIQWCIEQHQKTNHTYGDIGEPYSVHLNQVNNVAKKFFYLVEQGLNTKTNTATIAQIIQLACYGHDLIEDTRNTYNDVKKVLGEQVVDIVYALTNEKGKNRAQRANDKYYEGIRNTPYAVFVKLCDRIANVQYSKSRGSAMFEMYKKENSKFLQQMGYTNLIGEHIPTHKYKEMFDYLINLLETP